MCIGWEAKSLKHVSCLGRASLCQIFERQLGVDLPHPIYSSYGEEVCLTIRLLLRDSTLGSPTACKSTV